MGNRDAVHKISSTQRLEQGLAAWRMLLRFSKNPEDRAKAMKAIKELSRRLAMAEQGKSID